MIETRTSEAKLAPKVGCWRNVYFATAGRFCQGHQKWMGPGQVIGVARFPTRQAAREAFHRFGKLRSDDFYLGPKFFAD